MSARIVNGVIELDREITAEMIARKLAEQGGKLILPTEEQRAIIESRHFGATLIIAGAGSGKTETISQRVLWLVANGVVNPDQILGLTFTRKAASELSQRIRKRLRQLRTAGLLPTAENSGEEFRQKHLDIAVDVLTYHSYAGRTLAEHGIRMGIDTDGEPLGEAAAWQLAYNVVNSFTEVDAPIFHKPDYIVEAVMQLSGELGEHNASADEVAEYLRAFARQLDNVHDGNEEVRKLKRTIGEHLAILPMVKKLDEVRVSSGQLTFNDQMSYAALLAQSVPEISEIERARYKVVLLDEYQDTSYSQVRFLSSLFGNGHAVTAVGDPNQAIYGWRGASAETLGAFAETFGGNAREFDLLTTWRNDHGILDVSNRVLELISTRVRDLRGENSYHVNTLRARPDAGPGDVSCGLYLTLDDEAQAIAEYIAKLWNDPDRLAQDSADRSSFAVLVRARSYIPLIEMALRNLDIPVDVIGVGGLIHIPEIADIIALLRLITYPDSGTALARLLVGPRLALGPKDLAALGSYSRDLARRSKVGRSDRLEQIIETGSEENLDANDFAIGSIIEALDEIEQAPSARFSEVGLNRLKEFSKELAVLRRTMTGSITDRIQAAERFLYLDVEVLVRDGWQLGRRHLDKFLDEAASFQKTGASMSAFLTWLDMAEKREAGLKPTTVSVSNSAVQILTIHGAKGAEWDVVAIPGLQRGVFPSTNGGTKSWLKYPGSLPIEFRGDRSQFIDFQFPPGDLASNATEVRKAVEAFEDSQKARSLIEELRLGYVAFTRAKTHLFVTSSWFKEGKDPVDPSELFNLLHDYLEIIRPQSIASEVDQPTENPAIDNPRSALWPVANDAAIRIRNSASKVVSASALNIDQEIARTTDPSVLSLLHDAKALLEEADRTKVPELIYLPQRLSVSTLMSLQSDPSELALTIRRPMPRHSDRYAKRGTEFHLWVERYYGAQTLFDDDLFDPMAPVDVPLQELQQKWLASNWAAQNPISIEEGFETVINGIVLRGRIDAVYRDGDTYEVVDWKTGRVKEGEDLQTASIQLAMYRLAYSKQHNIPIENIRAAFYYVADDKTVYREALSSESEIASIIESITLI